MYKRHIIALAALLTSYGIVGQFDSLLPDPENRITKVDSLPGIPPPNPVLKYEGEIYDLEYWTLEYDLGAWHRVTIYSRKTGMFKYTLYRRSRLTNILGKKG